MSESITDAGKLEGDSVDGRLSFNQQVLMDRMNAGVSEYQSANSDFSSRASLLIGSSTAALSVISIAAVANNQASQCQLYSSVLASAILLIMIFLAIRLWMPRGTIVASGGDFKSTYVNYMSKNVDDIYYIVIRDTCAVYEEEKRQNANRAGILRWMCFGLVAQIVLLMVVMVAFASSGNNRSDVSKTDAVVQLENDPASNR